MSYKRLRIAMLLTFTAMVGAWAGVGVPVFLTAGQSNADGREYVSKLPSYMKAGYKHLKYTNVTSSSNGKFGELTFTDNSKRYSFCDVTHYFIDQAVDEDFYAIKCAYGGTAIDTAATYATLPVWCADSAWIARNNAYRGDIETGKSLTKSLTEGFADCVDGTLSKIEGGYDVKAIMWHQGESDRQKAGNYYKNFKDMITYMRQAIAKKTGNEEYLQLPFIFGTVSKNSKQYNSTVEKAQKQVAQDLPNVHYIDMSDAQLRSDALHFDSAWTEYLGKMMFNKLVELKLVKADPIEVVKPHVPSASDTLVVDAERSWNFAQPWSQATTDSLAADANWSVFQSLGHRYSKSMSTNQELATTGGYVFPETSGLYFKCGSGNRAILSPGKYICFYGDNLYLTIPKVSPGQTVTIVSATASSSKSRGITTDSGDYLELLEGGTQSTSKMTNKWKVKETLTEPVDLVFHSNGGATNVYSIEVSSPYVQILVGADQKVTFCSDKACDISKYADLIKAYVPTGYDAANEALVLKQTDVIPANTGVIVIGEESLVGAPVTTTDVTFPEDLLIPCLKDTVIEAGKTRASEALYVLQPQNGSVDFHRVSASASLSAGSAFLALPSSKAGDTQVIKASADFDVTSVKSIDVAGKATLKDNVWYNLNGVAVKTPTTPGIYIYNGQRFLIR